MKNNIRSLIFFSAVVSIFLSIQTEAQMNKGSSGPGQYFDFRKKSVSKEGSRWTLQEWMEQKDRNKMMDLWLAMYAPSPYEFYLSGSYLSNSSTTTNFLNAATTSSTVSSSRSSYQGRLGAYAYLVGVVVDYENNPTDSFSDLQGSLNFRIAGNSVQGTHLILQYGARDKYLSQSGINTVRLNQQFVGADLNLYVMKYFGIQTLYRSYFSTNVPSLGDVDAKRTEAGLFIDFWSLRIFGNWYQDIQNSTLNSTRQEINRTGIQSGLVFFF